MSPMEIVGLSPFSVPAEGALVGERKGQYVLDVEELDRLHDNVRSWDIVDALGVVANIKPSALVSYNPDLLHAVNKLGLSFCVFGYKPRSLDGMTVSKDPYLAQELAYMLTDGDGSDDQFRKIGKLLGYPESATEYYIKRHMTLETDSELPMIVPETIEGTIHKEFCRFILSPDHWNDEIDQYVMPLERATRELAPETFRAIEENVMRRKLATGVLSIAEVQIAQLSDEDVEQVA